ncbi:hypothetical protein EV361DRAFT_949375 [Lentinula raphanica]|nr:hypothetical protein EV361DRAFT_949375 [Lentinula raphanica]
MDPYLLWLHGLDSSEKTKGVHNHKSQRSKDFGLSTTSKLLPRGTDKEREVRFMFDSNTHIEEATEYPRIRLTMVAVTRAQAKRAAASSFTSATPAAVPAASNSPTSTRHKVRKQVYVSLTKRPELTNTRKTVRKPVDPKTTDDQSSIEHPTSPAKAPIEQSTSPHVFHAPFESLALPTTTASNALELPTPGWSRFGSSWRRETDLPVGLVSQIHEQQQANLALRANEAYQKQTQAMMQQHNMTYQWYDRMMTEGLQNAQEVHASLLLTGDTSGNSAALDTGNDGDIVMGNCEAGGLASHLEANRMPVGELSRNSALQTESLNGYSFQTDVPLPQFLMGKQLQPCPPGVQYSLISTPTEIIP